MTTSAWTKATHANIEGTPGPTFGGGYRVRIMAGKRLLATCHFACPVSHRTWTKVLKGGDLAYAAAKKYCAGFGVC